MQLQPLYNMLRCSVSLSITRPIPVHFYGVCEPELNGKKNPLPLHCTGRPLILSLKHLRPCQTLSRFFSCTQLERKLRPVSETKRAKGRKGRRKGGGVQRGNEKKEKKKGRRGAGGGGLSDSRSGVNCSFTRQLSIPQECGCCLYPDKLQHGYAGGVFLTPSAHLPAEYVSMSCA